MSRYRSSSRGQITKASLEVYTKEEFNYKRNNSGLMSTCLTWNYGNEQDDEIIETHNFQRSNPTQKNYPNRQDQQNVTKALNKTLPHPKNGLQPSSEPIKKSHTKVPARSSSAPKKPIVKKSNLEAYQKTPSQLQQQKEKQSQRRQKISTYIDGLIPYSRTLTNSKFQQYYKKPAPELYGAGNTSQPIGGTVYGNNLRTFNVNPHDFGAQPKNYQTYQTSLNFAFRMKRNEEKHWKTLQKELGKKLNLNQRNQTLKQGKKVVYVDVNDQNMYQVMKQNHQFAKQHNQQIRSSQKDYARQKQLKFQAEIDKFYRTKAENLQQNLAKTQSQTIHNDRPQGDRIREQVIYRHEDANGNIRCGGDRHALTCFVDINFPENDHLYTEELRKRNPIYPTEVEDRHKHLDLRKRQNFQKSKANVYPSHYVLPCNQQPEIQKMLMEKGKQAQIRSK